MKTAVVPALMAWMLMIPTGCSQQSSNGDSSVQPESNRALISDSNAAPAQSTLDQPTRENAEAIRDGIENVNARDSLGTTQLMDAALNNDGDGVILLVSRGADVNAVDNTLGQTALHLCAIGDNAQAGTALIRKGANVDARDSRGKTPLHEAAAAGAVGVIKLLLSSEAEIQHRDGVGKTPLHRAAQASQAEAVKMLLADGADPAVKDQRGKTASDYARLSGSAGTVAAFTN